METQINFKGSKALKENFKTLCNENDTDISKALITFMELCVENKLNPSEIDVYFNRTAKGSIMKYHNYTVSFLQSFEKTFMNRLEFYQANNSNYFEDMNKKMEIILRKNNIEKTVIDEILFNSQLILDIEDKDLGKSVYEKNYTAILKTEKLNENKEPK